MVETCIIGRETVRITFCTSEEADCDEGSLHQSIWRTR